MIDPPNFRKWREGRRHEPALAGDNALWPQRFRAIAMSRAYWSPAPASVGGKCPAGGGTVLTSQPCDSGHAISQRIPIGVDTRCAAFWQR